MRLIKNNILIYQEGNLNDLKNLLGKFLLECKNFEEKFNLFEKLFIFEFTTLSDLKQNALSDLNKKWFDDRKAQGNRGSFFKSVVHWDVEEDTILIEFRTKPTYINKKNPYKND